MPKVHILLILSKYRTPFLVLRNVGIQTPNATFGHTVHANHELILTVGSNTMYERGVLGQALHNARQYTLIKNQP